MKIKLTRDTIVNNAACEVGDVVDTDKRTGKYLIAIGKAVTVDATDTAPETATLPQEETAVIETADAKPAKKPKK